MSIKLVSEIIVINGDAIKFGNYIGETVIIDHRKYKVIDVSHDSMKCSLI